MKYYRVFAARSWEVDIIDVYRSLLHEMFNNLDRFGKRCVRNIHLLNIIPADADLENTDADYGSEAWIGIANDFSTIKFLASGKSYHTPDLCCVINGGKLGHVKFAEVYWNTRSKVYEVRTEFSDGEIISVPLRYRLVNE